MSDYNEKHNQGERKKFKKKQGDMASYGQDTDEWASPPPNYNDLTQATAPPLHTMPAQRVTVTEQPPMNIPSRSNTTPILIATGPLRLGKSSERIICHKCKAGIQTKTDRATGTLTWLVAGLICFIGGGCGCCLIPFCVDKCKDVEHFCPNCGAIQGRYSFI